MADGSGHLCGLPLNLAILVCLVFLVHLVHLVYLVYLVYLVCLVCLVCLVGLVDLVGLVCLVGLDHLTTPLSLFTFFGQVLHMEKLSPRASHAPEDNFVGVNAKRI